MFETRSTALERIDTGDHTPEEYERFLREIAFINKYLGDRRALRKTLLREIERKDLSRFSVLDVGCGSGELLRCIADFARRSGRSASLVGLDLNQTSAFITQNRSQEFSEISSVRADAFRLPFEDDSFDFAISSLFFHHLTDAQIPLVLNEMSRVARLGVYMIDLHRHPVAYGAYKLFCAAFRISPLVRDDGSLSILRGFKAEELRTLAEGSTLRDPQAVRIFPFRFVLMGSRSISSRRSNKSKANAW